jgi:hypothetical protein
VLDTRAVALSRLIAIAVIIGSFFHEPGERPR